MPKRHKWKNSEKLNCNILFYFKSQYKCNGLLHLFEINFNKKNKKIVQFNFRFLIFVYVSFGHHNFWKITFCIE